MNLLIIDCRIRDRHARAVLYDGSKESVEAVIDLIGRTTGVNNTPDYLCLRDSDGKLQFVDKGSWVAYNDRRDFDIVDAKMVSR